MELNNHDAEFDAEASYIDTDTKYKFIKDIILSENDVSYNIYLDVTVASDVKSGKIFTVKNMMDANGIELDSYSKHLPKLEKLGLIQRVTDVESRNNLVIENKGE